MNNSNNLYSIIHIEENCIEHMTTFTNRAKANAYFKRLIKQRFPHLKADEVNEAIEQGIIITFKGDTYNFVVHQNQN